MAGFALLFAPAAPPDDRAPAFAALLAATARTKALTGPPTTATAPWGAAAKLDAPPTLHRGIAQDAATGSWALAVGTVVGAEGVAPDGSLADVLQDYLAHGAAAFARLDGHFALVIADHRDESVHIVADPFGLVSIFYGQRGDQYFVSTSAAAVAQAIDAPLDEVGAREFLLYGGIFGALTLWAGVQRVLPATHVRLTRAGLTAGPYWTFTFDPALARLGENDAVACVIEAMTQAIRRSVRPEEMAWLSLTGGFDSRTLAALTHHAGVPFKTYCHGPQDSRDVQLAAHLSRALGWEHEYFALPADWGQQRPRWLAQTAGRADGQMGVLKRSRIVREQTLKAQQFPLSLWGFGGETYRGYAWKQEFLRAGTTTRVDYDRWLDYRLLAAHDGGVLADSARWRPAIRAQLKADIRAVGEQTPDLLNTVKLDLILQYLEHGSSGAALSTVLGLQRVLAPFDFKAGIACVLSVHHRWRQHSRLFRAMLAQLSPVLAEAATSDGGPAAPMRLANFPRFLPYWSGIGKKLLWGVTRRLWGRTLWVRRDAGTAGAAYPEAQWRRETVAALTEVLTPAQMYSGVLYAGEALPAFLAQVDAADFQGETLLDRIVTVELAQRMRHGVLQPEPDDSTER